MWCSVLPEHFPALRTTRRSDGLPSGVRERLCPPPAEREGFGRIPLPDGPVVPGGRSWLASSPTAAGAAVLPMFRPGAAPGGSDLRSGRYSAESVWCAAGPGASPPRTAPMELALSPFHAGSPAAGESAPQCAPWSAAARCGSSPSAAPPAPASGPPESPAALEERQADSLPPATGPEAPGTIVPPPAPPEPAVPPQRPGTARRRGTGRVSPERARPFRA